MTRHDLSETTTNGVRPELGAGAGADGSGDTSNGRRSLDRDAILTEAVRFIDEKGREQLTMRRLGAELGVEAMALYRYVPGREQLLDGVVEVVMNELNEKTVSGEQVDTWQEYLQQSAHAVRAVSIEHPRIFPLVASRPPAAPWLRPPLRSLRWVEDFLNGLAYHGFSPTQSVAVYRAFSTFLLGHLLLESSNALPGTPEIAEGEDIEFIETNDLSAYPRISELRSELAEDGFDDEFEDALEDLINRLEVSRGRLPGT